MTSHVENEIAARIARVRAEEERRRAEREQLAAARAAGIDRRNAAKLRRLAEKRQPTRNANTPDDEMREPTRRVNTPTPATKDKPMPVSARLAVCPSCRAQRTVRRVGAATVSGTVYDLVRCPQSGCGLLWCIRPEQARPVPAAA